MKCYKSVQNVESNGNIEMMYSSAELKAQARESEQEEGRNQPNTPGDGPEWGGLFVFISFSPLISKLMVDILMGGNTQMYYLNGRIDYNEIVTTSHQQHHTNIMQAYSTTTTTMFIHLVTIANTILLVPDLLKCLNFVNLAKANQH